MKKRRKEEKNETILKRPYKYYLFLFFSLPQKKVP